MAMEDYRKNVLLKYFIQMKVDLLRVNDHNRNIVLEFHFFSVQSVCLSVIFCHNVRYLSQIKALDKKYVKSSC